MIIRSIDRVTGIPHATVAQATQGIFHKMSLLQTVNNRLVFGKDRVNHGPFRRVTQSPYFPGYYRNCSDAESILKYINRIINSSEIDKVCQGSIAKELHTKSIPND